MPAPGDRLGERLGRYELRYLVARGGMASVYLAQLAGALEFQRWVAIKVMHPHLVDEDGGFVEMFLDEARLAARIQHPNVCQVIDFGEDAGTYYIVMEYLHGETLSALMKRAWREGQGISPVLAASVIAEVARGLHAAHELRGKDRELLHVVHRDVSPQNMMLLYDGIAKITDFGIARARGKMSTTQAGTLKGKFAYMSPEQLNGEVLDRRADIWSLGVVLWETTVGRHLFRGDSEGETALRVVQAPLVMPSELVDGYPKELEAILADVLARDREHRIPTAERLATRLEEFVRSAKYEHWGPAELGEYVSTVFADRRLQRDEMLNADVGELDEGVTVVDLASNSTAGSRIQPKSLSSVEVDLDLEQVASVPPAPTEAPAAKRPWWALPAIAIGLLSGLALGAVGYLTAAGDEDEVLASDPTATGDGPDAPSIVVSDVVIDGTPEREGSAEPRAASPGSGAEAPSDPDDAPSAPTTPDDPPAIPTPIGRTTDETNSETSDETNGETNVATGTPSIVPAESTASEGGGASPPDEAPSRVRTPPHEEPAPRETGTGQLNLLAIPRAEVRWHGRRIGDTPLVGYELPAGRQRLVLIASDGSGTRTVTVMIRDGERTSESVSFR
ncbi:MAG: protein kinase [Sandaracinaceae bacterium]